MTGRSSTGEARTRRTRTPAPYLFLLPAAALFLAFLLAPIAYSVLLGFRGLRVEGGLIGVRQEVFVGWENYAGALTDPELWASVGRMVVYGLIVVPIMLGSALLFALMLDAPRTRLARFSRLAIFLPYAVPSVIGSLLWGFLYLPAVSPLREITAGLGVPMPDFFGPRAIFGSVANIAIWGGVGFNMIVLYTALRAIPRELYDAARVDGAGEVRIALGVKIPLLRPALVMTAIFSLIATLQVFTEPTALRPLNNAITTTWMPLMKVWRDAFINGDIYSAAATSVVLAGATLLISLVLLRFLQARAFGEDR